MLFERDRTEKMKIKEIKNMKNGEKKCVESRLKIYYVEIERGYAAYRIRSGTFGAPDETNDFYFDINEYRKATIKFNSIVNSWGNK